MKVTISPKYENERTAIERVLNGTYTPLLTYCNKRNTVEKIEINGKPYVLKKFKPTGLFNGIIYTLLRKSKAQRAYEHAEILLANGIDTATPVAYAEQSRLGIFRRGYFLSEFIDAPLASEIIYDAENKVPADIKERFGIDLAVFIFNLHSGGIIPLDLNPNNIFYKRDDSGKFHLSLIDINRMETGKPPKLSKAMRNFFQLGISSWTLLYTVPHYAWRRKFDLDDCTYHILRWRNKWERNRRLKERFRRLFRK